VPVKNTRPPIDFPKKATGRLKNRNIFSSMRMKRNQGAPYVSDTTGKSVPGHEVGSSCKSKRSKYWSLLTRKRTRYFNNFWYLGDFNIQKAYLFSCIKATRPKRAYPRKRSKSDSYRSKMFSYHVKVEEVILIFIKKSLCLLMVFKSHLGD
jgi:hypothetical protein